MRFLWLLVVGGAMYAAGAEQPLPFSHKVHSAVGKLACQDCHPAPAKFGAAMGFPPAGKCMACHVLIAKDRPAIRKLAEMAAAKQAIPWVRVYRLADFVFFDHRYHLMNEATEQDVVTDSLGATKMVFCQGCHVKTHASGGCTTCHNTR